MTVVRPFRRAMAAILRIVVLVALLPVLGPAHAGHAHGAVVAGSAERARHGAVASAVGSHDDTRGLGAGLSQGMSVSRADATDAATSPCCPTCCSCHVFVAAADHAGGRSDRLTGRRMAAGSDARRPDGAAEAIPEPPRPFA